LPTVLTRRLEDSLPHDQSPPRDRPDPRPGHPRVNIPLQNRVADLKMAVESLEKAAGRRRSNEKDEQADEEVLRRETVEAEEGASVSPPDYVQIASMIRTIIGMPTPIPTGIVRVFDREAGYADYPGGLNRENLADSKSDSSGG
jgi:hypothetical protein